MYMYTDTRHIYDNHGAWMYLRWPKTATLVYSFAIFATFLYSSPNFYIYLQTITISPRLQFAPQLYITPHFSIFLYTFIIFSIQNCRIVEIIIKV